METTLYSTFLDDKEIACRIYEMLANDILGKEQLEKIKLRYDDMYRNFFNYSKEEAGKLIKSGLKPVSGNLVKELNHSPLRGGTVIMKTLLPCLYL